MDRKDILEEYRREHILVKMEHLLDEIKESYGKLKFIEQERKDIFNKPELSLHKMRHFKLLSELYIKLKGKNFTPLPILYEREGTIKDVYISEINMIEEIQSLLDEFNTSEEQKLIMNLMYDQQTYLFKLLYASL